MNLPPLPKPENEADSDGCTYACPEGYSAEQLRAYGESCARMAREEEREKLRALVLDDAWSLTFQRIGQYRTALASAIRKG